MVGRIVVELVADGSYRLCEQDGRLVHSWLPEIEDDDWLPIDRGGFDDHFDAMGFKLGVDLIRAEHGMGDVSPEQIEREREALDKLSPGRHATKSDPQAILDRFASRVREYGSSLDGWAARAVQRMQEPSMPIVEHRRIRVA